MCKTLLRFGLFKSLEAFLSKDSGSPSTRNNIAEGQNSH